MSLADLIRGKRATVATVAKIAGIAVANGQERETTAPTVAKIAGIAVANGQERETTTLTVAKIAGIAVANRQEAHIEIVANQNQKKENSYFATAISAIPATQPPNDLEDLPAELKHYATRYCIEIHNDPPDAVGVMLDDLRYYETALWPWLTDYFRTRLPTHLPSSTPIEPILSTPENPPWPTLSPPLPPIPAQPTSNPVLPGPPT